MRISSQADLHMHSTASDGSNGPEAFPDLAAGLGMQVFSLTDHDTVAGSVQILQQWAGRRDPADGKGSLYQPGRGVLLRAGEGKKIWFLPGVELSCRAGDIMCHLLGYCYDPDSPAIARVCQELEKRRIHKMEIRIDNLRKIDGITLTSEEKDWIFSMESPGRPHLARVLIGRGLAGSVDEAFRRYLNGIHNPVPGGISRIDARIAIESIRQAGGIAGWAHPLGGESDRRLGQWELKDQLRALAGLGIQDLECFYSRYDRGEEEFLVSQAGEYGLFVSGGSDYHGSNKTVLAGQLHCDDEPVQISRLSLLKEVIPV